MNNPGTNETNSEKDEEVAIIYNLTVKVDPFIADRWLQWLLEEHAPEIVKTGCFKDFRVVRLLEVDDSEGPTFAIQYHAASKADYNRYIEIYAADMRKKSFDKWGDRFLAFRSVMQVVK
jgi:hypothetical protein